MAAQNLVIRNGTVNDCCGRDRVVGDVADLHATATSTLPVHA